VAPKVSRVAVLLQSTNPAHPSLFLRIMTAGQKARIPVVVAQAGSIEEIGREFAVITKELANGVIVLGDPLFLQEARLLADQALRHRLPSISIAREFVEAGLLASYGANLKDNFRRAATFVDRILKGAKPAEMPIEQPTRYSLVINGKTAKGLGLTLSPAIVRQAEEVIQ